MGRNHLSLKKANTICTARKSATGNPFIVHDFFDLLEDLMQKYNFTDKQIWKGQTAYKTTSGARWENITTLALVNAAGRSLDPVLIFQGSLGSKFCLIHLFMVDQKMDG